MDAQASLLLNNSILSEGREKRTGTCELIHLRGRVIYRAVNSKCGLEDSWCSSAFGSLRTAEVRALRAKRVFPSNLQIRPCTDHQYLRTTKSAFPQLEEDRFSTSDGVP
jgi:hypothetical protein